MEGETPKWFEFNDEHVTPFHPKDIEPKTFGGFTIDTRIDKDGKVTTSRFSTTTLGLSCEGRTTKVLSYSWLFPSDHFAWCAAEPFFRSVLTKTEQEVTVKNEITKNAYILIYQRKGHSAQIAKYLKAHEEAMVLPLPTISLISSTSFPELHPSTPSSHPPTPAERELNHPVPAPPARSLSFL